MTLDISPFRRLFRFHSPVLTPTIDRLRACESNGGLGCEDGCTNANLLTYL